jgi:hypothetical protein
VFACELRIPEANYFVTKSVVYYPGKWQRDSVILRLYSPFSCL